MGYRTCSLQIFLTCDGEFTENYWKRLVFEIMECFVKPQLEMHPFQFHNYIENLIKIKASSLFIFQIERHCKFSCFSSRHCLNILFASRVCVTSDGILEEHSNASRKRRIH